MNGRLSPNILDSLERADLGGCPVEEQKLHEALQRVLRKAGVRRIVVIQWLKLARLTPRHSVGCE